MNDRHNFEQVIKIIMYFIGIAHNDSYGANTVPTTPTPGRAHPNHRFT
jgi:hypothetical protein